MCDTGNYGNMLDGRNDSVKSSAADAGADAEDETVLMTAEESSRDKERDEMNDEDWRSITEPIQPLTNDRSALSTV